VGTTLGVADSGRELSHKRFGNMSNNGIEILHKKNQLPGLKVVDMDLCEHCIYIKQKRTQFFTKEHMKKTRPLELVHSDVFDPSKVASIGGSTYFVTFMDDCTRKVWLYMMKNKSEVFGIFKTFKALVENQTGSKIKCLKSDNGAEYCLKEFDQYCAKHGIHRIKIVPLTPQDNSVAERMNRTILERARNMLSNLGLGKQLWTEVVSTTVYLINRGPSS